ncbi:WW domain binding protein VOPP1 isoform 2-T2 [Leptosomus discolor]
MNRFQPGVALLLSLLWECTEAKKHCWYFEGLYPTYYICRSYEDCCGSRCCVRALSIQRLWYFWVTTTWSAVLHRSRWTCGESHGYGFPRPAQFPTRKPGLPTPTFLLQHTTSPLRAGGEVLHVRTLWLSDLTVREEGAVPLRNK